jgi:transposase
LVLRGRSRDAREQMFAQAKALHAPGKSFVRDIDAVRNAIVEPWSSGKAEGQINRLKTLKRAMFGRAGIELLRARMLPLQ